MPTGDRIYFLADMHLKPLDAPNEAAREAARRDNERLAAFLAAIEGRATMLVLLGDAFNFWFERRGRVVGDYRTALGLFKAAADKGLDINHVCGNRDFVVGEGIVLDRAVRFPGFFRFRNGSTVSRLCDYGIEPRGPRYRFHYLGKTVCCVHGDALCTGDYVYMALRRFLQGWFGRQSMRWAPWAVAEWIIGRQQGRLGIRMSARRSVSFAKGAVWREMAMGADLLLCGHTHASHEEELDVAGRKCRFVSLPAWLDGWYGYLEDGVLHVEKM